MNNNNNNNNENNGSNLQQILEFEALLFPIQFGMNNFNFFLEQIPMMRIDTVPSLERYQRVLRFSERLNEMLPHNGSPRRDSPRYQSHISRMKNQNHEKYLQKRKQSIQNDKLDSSKPHIKITALRNMNINNNFNQYFINESGLIGSQKNTDSEDIIIGRTHRSQLDVIPNDILLPEDRIISRLHCKLVCKDYFRTEQIIDPVHSKLLTQFKLPHRAIKLIRSFLEYSIQSFREPKNAYVQDLGSVCGTQMKVMRQDPHIVQTDQKYTIGSDTYFIILDSQSLDSQAKQIDPDWYKLLKRLNTKTQPKHEIHFSDPRQTALYNSQDSEGTPELNHKEIYAKLKEYSIPIMIVKFGGQGTEINKLFNVFIGNLDKDSNEFQIGRGQENSVKINSNTISRKQSRLKYLKHSWVVCDGSLDRDSANGTWINLQTTEQADKKLESNLVKIENNTEIKISDFILKIELVKGKNSNSANLIKEFMAD